MRRQPKGKGKGKGKEAAAETKTKSKSKSKDVNADADPYPLFAAPTPEQCRCARDSLLALHGFPQELAQFRRSRTSDSQEQEEPSVLDGLILTLLSQSTTDSNSRRAFLRLKSAFPSWHLLLQAPSTAPLEDAIRCAGLARTKAARIKAILAALHTSHHGLALCSSLEYLRGLSIPQVKADLSRFKGLGIGPKTVACLLMFYLHKDDFPVDTHVFQITKAIGWIPTTATRESAYLHLNRRIPDDLKFDLNCLLVTHGKLCRSCKQPMRVHQSNASCPLLTPKTLLNNQDL